MHIVFHAIFSTFHCLTPVTDTKSFHTCLDLNGIWFCSSNLILNLLTCTFKVHQIALFFFNYTSNTVKYFVLYSFYILQIFCNGVTLLALITCHFATGEQKFLNCGSIKDISILLVFSPILMQLSLSLF